MFKGICKVFSLMIFAVIFASPELHATNCRIADKENFIRIGGRGNIAVRDKGSFSSSDLKVFIGPPEPPEWDDGEVATFEAGDVFTRIGEPKGGGVIYSGPANEGWLLYGPYYDVSGKTVGLRPNLIVTTDWQPDTYEYCSNHKYNPWTGVRSCVERSIGMQETSFYIDMAMMNSGKLEVFFSQTLKNFNNLSKNKITLPLFICTGDVSQVEVRIGDLKGGTIKKFQVHRVQIESWWTYH